MQYIHEIYSEKVLVDNSVEIANAYEKLFIMVKIGNMSIVSKSKGLYLKKPVLRSIM